MKAKTILLCCLLGAHLSAQSQPAAILNNTDSCVLISNQDSIFNVRDISSNIIFGPGVSINCSTGKVTIPEGVKLDDAARAFWDAIQKEYPHTFPQPVRDRDETWRLITMLADAEWITQELIDSVRTGGEAFDHEPKEKARTQRIITGLEERRKAVADELARQRAKLMQP